MCIALLRASAGAAFVELAPDPRQFLLSPPVVTEIRFSIDNQFYIGMWQTNGAWLRWCNDSNECLHPDTPATHVNGYCDNVSWYFNRNTLVIWTNRGLSVESNNVVHKSTEGAKHVLFLALNLGLSQQAPGSLRWLDDGHFVSVLDMTGFRRHTIRTQGRVVWSEGRILEAVCRKSVLRPAPKSDLSLRLVYDYDRDNGPLARFPRGWSTLRARHGAEPLKWETNASMARIYALKTSPTPQPFSAFMPSNARLARAEFVSWIEGTNNVRLTHDGRLSRVMPASVTGSTRPLTRAAQFFWLVAAVLLAAGPLFFFLIGRKERKRANNKPTVPSR